VVEPGTDGTSTVSFAPPGTTPPYIPFSTAPVAVSRVETTRAEERSPETGRVTSPAEYAPTYGEMLPTAAQVDAQVGELVEDSPESKQEAQYEYVLQRLRRDLLLEREQYGSLLNDNP
jgi:hypothetical protein